jgi:hypothetical protein
MINSSSDNSSIILDCPAGYSIQNGFLGVDNVTNGAVRVAGGSIRAVVVAAAATLFTQDSDLEDDSEGANMK